MRKALAAVLLPLVVALPAYAAEPIGKALESLNDVKGTLDALTRAIGSGDNVSASEVVETGTESAVLIGFLDDTKLNVGASSTIVLDRFVYDPEGSAENAVLNLTKGAFRFVTGKSDPSKFEIRTEVATLGIRGTDFVVICDGENRCAVVVANGVVKVCPWPDLPVDCPAAFSLDRTRNTTIVEANGRSIGARSIPPSLVAAILAAVANGTELDPTIVALGLNPPAPSRTPVPINASPG